MKCASFTASYSLLPKEQRARFQRHHVRSGDTLGAIAQRYGVRVEDIVSINKISNPRALRVGSDLIIPIAGGGSATVARQTLQDDHQRTRQTTYTVRKGDSLWGIARRFDVTEQQLRVWNKLGWNNSIHPGQVLVVSQRSAPAAAASTATRPAARPQTTYTVKSGDNLWAIARRFNVTEQQIRDWNNLGRNAVIHPGQVLIVGAQVASAAAGGGDSLRRITYQVRPGDTLWGISQRYDVAMREIRTWNNLSDEHVLRPGDTLTLLVKEGRQG